MDKVFFIGIIIGLITRLIMLNLEQKQKTKTISYTT